MCLADGGALPAEAEAPHANRRPVVAYTAQCHRNTRNVKYRSRRKYNMLLFPV